MRRLTPQEQRNREFGRISNASGTEGERFAEAILRPVNGERLKDKQEGADFVIPGRIPQYLEVKSTFGGRPDKAIVLKTREGKWANELAKHVLIVTNTHAYFADAGALKAYVHERFNSFERLPKKRRETITRIIVPVADLEAHGVAIGVEQGRADLIARIVKRIAARAQATPYRRSEAMFAPHPARGIPFARRPQFNRRIPPRR